MTPPRRTSSAHHPPKKIAVAQAMRHPAVKVFLRRLNGPQDSAGPGLAADWLPRSRVAASAHDLRYLPHLAPLAEDRVDEQVEEALENLGLSRADFRECRFCRKWFIAADTRRVYCPNSDCKERARAERDRLGSRKK